MDALAINELKNVFSAEKIEDYRKKMDICRNALNPIQKLILMIRYPEEFIGEFDKLLKALLIVMAVDFVLFNVQNYKATTLTPQVALKNFFGKVVLLVIIFAVIAVDDAMPNIDFKDVFITLALMYGILYAIDNAEKAGIPIPDWLGNLVRKIITAIEELIERIFKGGGRGGQG